MDIKELEGFTFGDKKKTQVKNQKASRRAGFIQKNLASSIDFIIISVIRFLTLAILFVFWYYLRGKGIMQNIDFINNPKGYFSYFNFFKDALPAILAFLISGGLYFALLQRSSVQATLGEYIADIKIIDRKTGDKAKFFKLFFRHILNLFPLLFAFLIVVKLIAGSTDALLLILVILFVIWYDLWLFTRFNGGVPDLIMGTELITVKAPKPSKFSFVKQYFKKQ